MWLLNILLKAHSMSAILMEKARKHAWNMFAAASHKCYFDDNKPQLKPAGVGLLLRHLQLQLHCDLKGTVLLSGMQWPKPVYPCSRSLK